MPVLTKHFKQLGPNRVRTTYHFTRQDMLRQHVVAMRKTAIDLPSKRITVYESEEVVIVERNLV